MRLRISINHVRVLAACLAFLSLVLVGLGGYVRGTGAGLSCPDWPLCYGRVVPESFGAGIAQEVIHRYLASFVSCGALGLALISYVNRKSYPKIWLLMRLALACLLIQVVLGGLTVLMLLNPFIVTAHLAVGTLFTQILAALALDPMPERPREQDIRRMERAGSAEPRMYAKLVAGFACVVYLQIVLGGFVGSSGASLACPDIPFCNGMLVPINASAPQIIQMLHRANGFFIFFLGLLLLALAPKLSSGKRKNRGHLLGVCVLVVLQISLGLTSVYFRVPVSLAVTHLVLAQLILFGIVSYYRRTSPMRSVFLNSQRSSGDFELGEYSPTKRSFIANIR